MKTYEFELDIPALPQLVEEVQHGEEIVLTDHSKPVAKIVAINEVPAKVTSKAGSLPVPFRELFPGQLLSHGLHIKPIESAHLYEVEQLPTITEILLIA